MNKALSHTGNSAHSTQPAAREMSIVKLGPPRSVRLLFWAIGFGLALLLAVQYGGANPGVKNDFTQNVWLPARLVLDGASPYAPSRAEVDAALGIYSPQLETFNSGRNFHFIYPMWLALLLSPFALLSLPLALAVWRALNLLLLVWSVGTFLRSSTPAFRANSPVAIGALAFTVLLAVFYRESLLTIIIGQFAIIELGLLAAVWAWLIRSRDMDANRRLIGDILSGVALAVLATKPQAVGLPVILLGLWALSRRRFALAGSSVVSLAALLLLPVLFYPSSLTDWLTMIFSGQAASQAEESASVWGLSYYLLGEDSPWRLISLALSLAGVAALLPRWRRDLNDKTSPLPFSLPLTLCMNSVISPYMLGYEHVLLLFPALVLLAAAGLPDTTSDAHKAIDRKLWRLAMYIWMAALPMLIVPVQSGLDREWPAIFQSLPMLAILWLTGLEWREEGRRVTSNE